MLRLLAVFFLLVAGIAPSIRSIGFAVAFYLWHNIFRPLDFARVQGAFPTADLVIALLVISFIINAAKGKFRIRFNAFFWLTLAFLFWILICALHTDLTPPPSRELTPIGAWVVIVKYLAPIAVISTCLGNFNDIRRTACTLAVSVGIWGAWLGLGGILHGTNEEMCIPGGQLGERNFFSAAVAAIIPILFYFGKTYDWKFRTPVRLGLYAMTILNGAAVVFANSRGAVVSFLGMICFYLMLISQNKIKHGVMILAIGSIVYNILPESIFQRMSTIQLSGEQTESSAKERTLLMQSAFRCTKDYPIFGVGPFCWQTISRTYTGLNKNMEPHDMWLLCSAETGLVGLGLLVSILLLTLWRLIRVSRRKGNPETQRRSALAKTLSTSILGYSIGLTFLNFYCMELYWAMFAVGNALFILPRSSSATAIRKIARDPSLH